MVLLKNPNKNRFRNIYDKKNSFKFKKTEIPRKRQLITEIKLKSR